MKSGKQFELDKFVNIGKDKIIKTNVQFISFGKGIYAIIAQNDSIRFISCNAYTRNEESGLLISFTLIRITFINSLFWETIKNDH